jgi:hypothetical protein
MSRIKYLLIAMLLIISASFAQSITNYSFTATSGTFTPLSGGTTVPTLLADGAAATVPIGFDFWYMGVKYTSAVAVSDGFLSFNPSATTSLTNNLATCSATYRPLVAPLWDDLDGRATGGSQASYLTTGTPGSRVFTFEWLNWEWNYASSNPVISFQVKLYEATGVVEFVYQDETGAVNSGSASIGITAVATGAGNYLSLDGTGIAPNASSIAETNTLNVEPATGQTYTFTPPAAPPTPGGPITFSSVTRYAMTLEWFDVAGEAGYAIYRSINDTTYTFVSNNAANDTDYAASGLTPGTTYYWRVYAFVEGSASSPLAGNQITLPPVIPAAPINLAFSV